jgi:hypothetical protein
MENVADSRTPSLTCKIITRPYKKFGNGRTVQNGQSGRPCSAAWNKTVMTVTGLHTICKAIHVAVRLVSLKTSIHHILQHEKWQPYIPSWLNAMNKDDPER